MKVICIDASGLKKIESFTLVENEIYEVIDHRVLLGDDCYCVFNNGEYMHYYKTSRFIPLSNIDELQLEYKKQFSILNLFSWLK